MKAIKIITAMLLLSLTVQAQQHESEIKKPALRQFGFGIGFQSRQLVDAQKSALVYLSREYNAGLFFKSEMARSIFSVDLDFSMGSFDAKHFRNRWLYSTEYDIDGNISEDSVPVVSGILSGQFNISILRKLPAEGSIQWFAGTSIKDILVYPENYIGLLNSLSWNANLLAVKNFHEKHRLGIQLLVPLAAVNTRLPWHNTATDPVEPEAKTVFKKGTRLVTVNNFQSLQLNVFYTHRFSSRWSIGADYDFTWLRIPYYQPMKSIQNRIRLFTTYSF
jgi:hypothetical protein